MFEIGTIFTLGPENNQVIIFDSSKDYIFQTIALKDGKVNSNQLPVSCNKYYWKFKSYQKPTKTSLELVKKYTLDWIFNRPQIRFNF